MTSPLYRLPSRDAEVRSRAYLRGVVTGGIGALVTLWLALEALEVLRGWLWG
jgi:hypothetical protein